MTSNITKNKFQRNKNATSHSIDERIYILDENSDEILHLNETASLIWKSIKTPKTLKQIVDLVLEQYDTKPTIAEKDVKKILNRFSKSKLLKK